MGFALGQYILVLPFCKHSTMVSIQASQAWDAGSIPVACSK
jgi:hypothetical protein